MSDGNSVQFNFGANTSALDSGAQEVKGQIAGIGATVKGVIDLFLELGGAATGSFREIRTGATEAAEKVKGTATAITEMREAIAGIGEALVAAFAVEQLTEFARKMGETAEEIDHTAITFGLTTAQVQQMKAEAAGLGLPFDAFTTAMMRSDKALTTAREGSKQSAAAFKMLGINIHEPVDNLTLFNREIAGLANIQDVPTRVGVAMQVFGRNIQSIAPLIGVTKEQLADLNKAIADSGAISDVAEQKGLALADAFNMNKVAMQGLGNVLTDALAPAFTSIVQGVTQLITGFVKSYQEGGTAKQVMDAIAWTVKELADVFALLGATAIYVWDTIDGAAWMGAGVLKAVFDGIWDGIKTNIDAWKTLGDVIRDVLTLNWGAVAGDITSGLRRVASDVVNIATDMGKDAAEGFKKGAGEWKAGDDLMAKYQKWSDGMWKGGGKLPALPKAAGGAGDMATDEKKPKKTAAPGSDHASDIDQWRTELADKLNLEQNWGADEHAISLQFWTDKLAIARQNIASEIAATKAGTKARAEAERKGQEELLEIERLIDAQKKALRQEARAEELAETKETVQLAGIEGKQQLDAIKASAEQRKAMVAAQAQEGVISKRAAAEQTKAIDAEVLQAQLANEQASYDAQQDALNKEANLKGTTVARINEILREEETMQAEHNARMAAFYNADATAEVQAKIKAQEAVSAEGHSWIEPVVSSFSSGLGNMLLHAKTWGDAVKGIYESFAETAIKKLSDVVSNWIVQHLWMTAFQRAQSAIQVATHGTAEVAKTVATTAGTTTRASAEVSSSLIVRMIETIKTALHIGHEATKTAATVAGATTRATAETTANTAAAVAQKVAAAAQVASLAGLAGAGGVASMAAAPFPIDLGAPAFGASMAAAAAAFGTVASAAGGWGEIPEDQMAVVHKKEMILPASIAEPLRGALAGKTSAAGLLGATSKAADNLRTENNTATTHLDYRPNITNPEPDLMKQLDGHSAEVIRMLKNLQRNGKF